MSSFDFSILKKSTKSKARLGILKTPHGNIKTPAFITVGTKGTVKSLTPDDLETIGTQMVFVNTYHTVLSPGVEVIEKVGGIHAFSGINKPIITDSGGFQVFSLARNSITEVGTGHCPVPTNEITLTRKTLNHVKITDDGVEFRSPIDGTKYFFTPEFSIQAQQKIGADLIVAFDECVPYGASYEYTKKALERTHKWAQRSLNQHNIKVGVGRDRPLQVLYGVIQGGCFEDLRKESARFISALPFFGLAIGGVSVGETKKEMRDQVRWVMDELGDDPRPRHLLGIGEFDDIFDAVAMGIDTMDCVIPTRHARMGKLYVDQNPKSKVSRTTGFPQTGSYATRFAGKSPEKYGEIDILKQGYKKDLNSIDANCECYTCQHFTRAYLHHLFKQRELLAYHLATIHNLYFIEQIFFDIRKSIADDLI